MFYYHYLFIFNKWSLIKMSKKFVILTVFVLSITYFAKSEEGMWTFFNLPIKQIEEKYNFKPTQEWLDKVRLSSVRFMDGGSGSFVSSNGLVMTNHHVGVGQITKLSSQGKDYVNDGFYAKTFAEELKCKDLEVNVLVNMIDVTSRVKSVAKENMSAKEINEARSKEIDKIETEYSEKTGLRSDVVSFYNGGEYWLYQYKKYTDVRLVFAPERNAAYFGGDNDNFTYPRWNLDVTFFRVYENDKPLKTDNYFKWSKNGAANDELVFMSGHPGKTSRLKTYRQILFARDYTIPHRLESIQTTLDALGNYARQGEEQARRALIYQFGYENSKKAIMGQLNGLKNPDLISLKENEEKDFRGQILQDPEKAKLYMKYFDQIDELIKLYETKYYKREYRSFRSRLFGIALGMVRYATESIKQDNDRLPGYNDAALPNMKFHLLSPAPIYKDVDKALTWASVKYSLHKLDVTDEFWRLFFEGGDPRQIVNKLIDDSKLDNLEIRKALLEGGLEALKKSDDPMIQLALKVDEFLRKDEKEYRDNFESKLKEAEEKIAEARFAVYGKTKYPDANFTLRLTYGTVKGYPMNGTIAPTFTTLYGMFDRAVSFGNKGDFELPKRFWDRLPKLDLSTPVNFVSTCDIIGGNSGSPTINKNAEIVGIVFDGNIESLPGDYIYDINANRAVSVHSNFILYALRNLYDANNLADELIGK